MLETELKKLTAAIYELNATIEALGGLPSTPAAHSGKSVKNVVEEAVGKKPVEDGAPEVDETDEPEEEIPDADSDKAYTVDDIRSMALAISRKDRSKQKDIKAKLAEHGAKLATDLKGDDLIAVGSWMDSLKKELGA